ncbi:DUF429 domain-containing protein, partial [bacterium]|nr:DUF429 domain-containing protein [candidate division CSSED10-310 bacterium]
SSVFPTPCRNALKFDDYMQASAMNWSCTGRKLSRQVWNIMPRIREVDLYIRRRRLRGKIREMHPEVVFWALNGKVPLEHSKHTAEGIGARSRLLSPLFPGLPELIRSVGENGWFGRGLVAEDDVLDAVAGAVTATCKSALRTLPAIPEADRYGLPMEVVYPDVS